MDGIDLTGPLVDFDGVPHAIIAGVPYKVHRHDRGPCYVIYKGEVHRLKLFQSPSEHVMARNVNVCPSDTSTTYDSDDYSLTSTPQKHGVYSTSSSDSSPVDSVSRSTSTSSACSASSPFGQLALSGPCSPPSSSPLFEASCSPYRDDHHLPPGIQASFTLKRLGVIPFFAPPPESVIEHPLSTELDRDACERSTASETSELSSSSTSDEPAKSPLSPILREAPLEVNMSASASDSLDRSTFLPCPTRALSDSSALSLIFTSDRSEDLIDL